MTFAVRGHASAEEFLAAAGAFLEAREAEHNLSNPTSNNIYRAIGYESVRDVDQDRFGADA